jgi:hypothetical protein
MRVSVFVCGGGMCICLRVRVPVCVSAGACM